jgi:hypothetical protein
MFRSNCGTANAIQPDQASGVCCFFSGVERRLDASANRERPTPSGCSTASTFFVASLSLILAASPDARAIRFEKGRRHHDW